MVRELATRTDLPLSVDTYKAETARQALEAGAHVINDITALHGDPGMAAVVRDSGGRPGPHAHAGDAADHAAEPDV